MNRRDFLRSAGVMSAAVAWPESARLFAMDASAGGWRTFEVTTRVELLKSSGAALVWLPTALRSKTPFQKTLSDKFTAEGGTAEIVESNHDGLGIVAAKFPAGVPPVLTLTSRVATRDFSANLSEPSRAPNASRAELEYFLRPTKLLPTDGLVKEKATNITKGAKTDLEKARAIYEWIVDNTFRDPQARGCGLGDIGFMLQTGDLGGKCADLNSLFVGLARSAKACPRAMYSGFALPARGWDTRASACRLRTSPKRSTAERRSTLRDTVGFRSIPRMCGKLFWRSHLEIARWTTSW